MIIFVIMLLLALLAEQTGTALEFYTFAYLLTMIYVPASRGDIATLKEELKRARTKHPRV